MEFNQEVIDQLKAKHKEVYEISVVGKSCLVLKPNRKDMCFAMAGSSSGKDIVRMQEILLENCWLEGDEEIKTDDALFFAAAAKLTGLMEAKEAELKKL